MKLSAVKKKLCNIVLSAENDDLKMKYCRFAIKIICFYSEASNSIKKYRILLKNVYIFVHNFYKMINMLWQHRMTNYYKEDKILRDYRDKSTKHQG